MIKNNNSISDMPEEVLEEMYNKHRNEEYGKILDSAIITSEVDDSLTPNKYSDHLLMLLGEYNENKIKECMEKEYFIEAIVTLHKHIGEQLRFLLIKQTKGFVNIPLSISDERLKELVELLKGMDDFSLIRMSFIYERINLESKNKLWELNSTRNKFVHAFNKDELNEIFKNSGYLKGLIKCCMKIEKDLTVLVRRYQ
jgi:hypothetical protein